MAAAIAPWKGGNYDSSRTHVGDYATYLPLGNALLGVVRVCRHPAVTRKHPIPTNGWNAKLPARLGLKELDDLVACEAWQGPIGVLAA